MKKTSQQWIHSSITIILLIMSIVLFIIAIVKDNKNPKIISADEYCISQGFDKAGEKDGVGSYKRVKCLKGETSFYVVPIST